MAMNKLFGIGLFGLASWFILRMARAQNVSENALFSLVVLIMEIVNQILNILLLEI